MIIAVTGHRPEDCIHDESTVRRRLRETFDESRPQVVIVGMASGTDIWSGIEALDLGIEVWAAKPWTGHTPRKADEQVYARIIAEAGRVVNVTESDDYPGPWAYHKRNEWMVDHATHVLAYLNPSKNSGGTFACVNYANKVEKPVRNIAKD